MICRDVQGSLRGRRILPVPGREVFVKIPHPLRIALERQQGCEILRIGIFPDALQGIPECRDSYRCFPSSNEILDAKSGCECPQNPFTGSKSAIGKFLGHGLEKFFAFGR